MQVSSRLEATRRNTPHVPHAPRPSLLQLPSSSQGSHDSQPAASPRPTFPAAQLSAMHAPAQKPHSTSQEGPAKSPVSSVKLASPVIMESLAQRFEAGSLSARQSGPMPPDHFREAASQGPSSARDHTPLESANLHPQRHAGGASTPQLVSNAQTGGTTSAGPLSARDYSQHPRSESNDRPSSNAKGPFSARHISHQPSQHQHQQPQPQGQQQSTARDSGISNGPLSVRDGMWETAGISLTQQRPGTRWHAANHQQDSQAARPNLSTPGLTGLPSQLDGPDCEESLPRMVLGAQSPGIRPHCLSSAGML